MASDTIIIGKDKIQELIPQRPPFVMIDELVSTDEVKTVSRLTVSNSNIFCREGKFLEAGMVENIAQTAAARAGYVSVSQNRKPPVGFIGAVKNLQVHFNPKEGDVLNTEMSVINQIMDVAIIYGKVFCNGKIAAECEMKIFEKKD